MINILTDSCVDLSPELAARYQIDRIPLPVFINNQTYLDGIDIQTADLFKMVEKTKQLPKTSAPPVLEFSRFFDRPGENIYIGLSSKLSITVSNAHLACENLTGRPIWIIDSLNLSTGIGLLVLKAAELRDAGRSSAEIVSQIQASIPKIRTSFVIDTLDYLYMGGRCSAMTHVVGSLLKIRPVIEVRQDGTLGVKDKIRGSRKKSLDSLIQDFENHLPELDRHRVFITHTGCDSDAEYLAQAISAKATIDEINITIAGSTIASHCGPDTIGILYCTL